LPVAIVVLNDGAFTVIVFVTAAFAHAPVIEYDITTVPAAIGVTTPDELTVAIAVLELDQVPPEVELANVIVEPEQTDEEPVIAANVTIVFPVEV
jgi:hypothetical protein